ncbi:arylsulfatase [Colwelliaceae bacterium BS250]
MNKIHLRSKLLLALLLTVTSSAMAAEDRPNVLLILTDDQGYSDVGFNGNPIVSTPNLDRMASQAIVFDNFYAQPVCSTTRAALMTGRYAMRSDVINTQQGVSTLPPSATTIAEALKADGYRTGLFGKWHLGDNAPARPQDQGFDRVLTHEAGMIGMTYSPLDGQSYFNPILKEDGIDKRFKGYAPDIFTDATIDFILATDSADDKAPFFAYLSFNTPHHPLTVSDKYADPYRKAGLSEETSRYYGMISNIDENFTRILAALKAKGIADNTLIIFLGDNGTSSLHKQSDLWESGLKGRKTYIYENGIRVPMFIKLPLSQTKQSKTTQPKTSAIRLTNLASVEDLMPTILDITKVSTKVKFDGQSLTPILADPAIELPDRSFYFQFHRGTKPEPYRNIAVRKGAFKLAQPVGRKGEYSDKTAHFELYNIDNDPNELNNIAASNPEKLAELKADYDAWLSDANADGINPVKTWIGSDLQNPVNLTRQDWQGGGLFDGDNGFYDLEVKTAGKYRLTFRWSDLLHKTHDVTIKLNDTVIKKQILLEESEARIEEIQLDKGPLRLEAWLDIDNKKNGFRFIEIEKIEG